MRLILHYDEGREMIRRLLLPLALALVALAAPNIRLYLKDGDYHLVREYKVEGDRVRYYSVERGDWEEIPLEMVDIKKTETEVGERAKAREEEAKLLTAEDRAERERAEEIARVPYGPGVHWVDGKQLTPMKAAESKVHNNKTRNVLKVLTPVPVLSGKATVELDGEQAAMKIGAERPEFYIRLSSEQRYGIFRLTPSKGVRIVEKVQFVPVTKEVIEEPIVVEIFRQQVDDNLFKIWPTKPLEPGEYAVVEYTEGKLNLQIWDFAVVAPAK
jgi:hypothetical protein